jgi:hypothetical protein
MKKKRENNDIILREDALDWNEIVFFGTQSAPCRKRAFPCNSNIFLEKVWEEKGEKRKQST